MAGWAYGFDAKGNESYWNYEDFDRQEWHRRVSASVFRLLVIVGLIAYIPGVYFALLNGLLGLAAVNTVAYVLCLLFSISRSIPTVVRSTVLSIILFSLGAYLLITLGPMGAGSAWLIGALIVSAFLLGELASILSFSAIVILYVVVYILLQRGALSWTVGSAETWLVKIANLVVIDLVLVITNSLYQRGLFKLLAVRTEARNASMVGLAKLAEYRDIDTGEHLFRIQEFVTLLGRSLSRKSEYSTYVTEAYLSDLRMSSILHDIGKVGISDSVLLKKGPLSEEEFNEIKTHPVIGYRVIQGLEGRISGRSIYTLGKEIARSHHERWDGTGYPDGLSGTVIPLASRIVALADVYDALTSQRPYKGPLSHDDAKNVIVQEKGSHFDPDIVDAFLDVCDQFKEMRTGKKGN